MTNIKYTIGAVLWGIATLVATPSMAQTELQAPLATDWHLQDPATSPYQGISLDKAYDLLKDRKAKPIIVGVIDSGIDTLHEDLKSVLWTSSKKEKSYPGQKYGWSYLGSRAGNVNKEQLKYVRLVKTARLKGDTTGAVYNELMTTYEKARREAAEAAFGSGYYLQLLDSVTGLMGKGNPTLADFENLEITFPALKGLTGKVRMGLARGGDYAAYRAGLQGYHDHFKKQLDYDLNLNYDPRKVVGDDPSQATEKYYGTGDVNAADPTHGTHVSGIIAADRKNDIGMKGILSNVSILTVRAVPDGDERDKDIANAIYYAVDHGARVINMSFGKAYSPDKAVVDKAVKYAMKEDVLLIHAAGNDHKDIDSLPNFPTPFFSDHTKASNWITVGASGPSKENLVAGFSNYGAKTVDLFAPGVDIYATVPGNTYARFSGTSMASPVAAGIAALIRSYFPKLKATEVKEILLKSIVAYPELKDKCVTGGVINAARAVELAIQSGHK